MDQELVDKFLAGDSDEIADLRSNLQVLDGFIDLARNINALPDVSSRFYEESRSLFQTTATGRNMEELENLLSNFFGKPTKSAGKALPRKLRKSSVVKFLGGIQKDQSLFIVSLKTGHFYGALWPWRRNKSKVEIHLGYCSDWMTDEDYQSLEDLVHQSVSRSAFEQMDANIGGQIHGISLPSFLQMAEMEKSTFTLRVTSRHRVGALHLSDGELTAAELDDLTGAQAAYRIISWDDASINIEPLKTSMPDEIKQPLMHVLMESLKLKDEAADRQEEPPAPPRERTAPAQPAMDPTRPAKRLVRLERAPTPRARKNRMSLAALAGIAVGIFAIIAVIVVATFHILDNRRASDGYHELMGKTQKAKTLEHELELLQTYLDEDPATVHGKPIRAQIENVLERIEDRDYDKATLTVSALPVDENYETEAIRIYSDFLKTYPNSRHTQSINQSITEIKNLLDKYYYDELVRAARLDFNQRLDIYSQYLSQFPDGSYREDVEVLINEMGEKHLDYLREDSKICKEKRRWDPCIQRCDKFIIAYQGLQLAESAAQLRKQMIGDRDLDQLRRQALDAGTDYRKSYRIYSRFLEQHPDSAQQEAIEKELKALGKMVQAQEKWTAVKTYATNTKNPIFERIQRLDRYMRANKSGEYSSDASDIMRQLESERQASLRRQKAESKLRDEQARIRRQQEERARRQQRARELQGQWEAKLQNSGRYRANGDGTMTDSKSGLMWTLLDSHQILGGCLDYPSGRKYAHGINHGGFNDWRLPSSSELASIYKQKPFYPSSGAQWYWSSESYTKGYHTVVNIVTTRPETIYQRDNRTEDECGSVRAVRSP